jgi:hypothetical protein
MKKLRILQSSVLRYYVVLQVLTNYSEEYLVSVHFCRMLRHNAEE